jgi:hypothetical protein
MPPENQHAAMAPVAIFAVTIDEAKAGLQEERGKTKIQKKNFILILQGDDDKIFNCKHIQEMIDNNNLIYFASLEIIKGDHFYPAEFKVWCKLLCNF